MALEREATWLTESCEFSIDELAEASGLSEPELREFVEYGAIAPVDRQAASWRFTGRCLVTVRRVSRLRTELELDAHGVALVLALLERIGDLEAEVASLRAQMPRRL